MEVFVVYLVSALALLLASPRLIHIFQLESYKQPQLFLRLKEDRSIARRRLALMGRAVGIQVAVYIVLLVVSTVLDLAIGTRLPLMLENLLLVSPDVLSPLAFAAVLFADWLHWRRQPSKKPLVVTARVKRLLAALAVVLLLLFLVVYGATVGLAVVSRTGISFTVMYLLLFATEALALAGLPRFLALAAKFASPMEKAVQRWYLGDAKKRLAARPDLIRVGITGSFGKTSVKVILATILGEKYNTLATPASYNTPMGLTRVVREQLKPEHEVLIAEMGARHIGDIAELCALIKPKYGLITSVGAQHLETFFTIENVAKTKYELVDALPNDGMAFLPQDDGLCLGLYRKTRKPKMLFGLDAPHGEKLSMTARDISHGPEGSRFLLVGPDGRSIPCRTRLLGLHNIQNILGAAAVAHALGLTLEQIAAGIGRAQPVEHRLQLIESGNGVAVIDDAFNSNPAGCRAALAVLKDFPGRKIIVTPGLVELGSAEDAENEGFGRAMAEVVDIAILVARNGEAMRRGLLAAGFDESSIVMAPRLSDATAVLGQLTRAGDTVLFENDLPDHYEG